MHRHFFLRIGKLAHTMMFCFIVACGGGSGSGTNGVDLGGSNNASLAWMAQAYLKAPNAQAGNWFGEAVAISGDTVVIGARQEASNQATITNGTGASSDNSFGNSGAAYVLRQTAGVWVQEAYLKAPNVGASDNFGYSVAISGDTIVVGAIFEQSNQATITNGATASSNNSLAGAGAAYVFKRTGSTWFAEAYLKAPNVGASDSFGSAVAISGDTIVVGARDEASNQITITNGTTASVDNSAAGAGAAYVFKRSGSTWVHEAYLKAPNAQAGDNFGNSVAISDDTVVVGAPTEASNQSTITNGATASSNNSFAGSGAAYVFKRTGSVWASEAYLKAANTNTNDQFGTSVAISGDTVVVGANYEASNQTTITNGSTASSNNSASDSGAAYVFKRTGSAWAQEAYLKASNAKQEHQFGYSVSISGDRIAIGAFKEGSPQTTITNGETASSDSSAVGTGAAYVFKRTGSTWVQEAYFKATNAEQNDYFGYSIGLSGSTIIVGAHMESSNQTTITNGSTASANNSAAESGAGYLFNRQ